MSKPLFFKELRETWWMALVASFVVLCAVVNAMGLSLDHEWRIIWSRGLRQSPFLDNDFTLTIGMTAICLGVALGLWQTLAENVAGTWSYLLHRPVSRRRVIAAKLLTGIGLIVFGIGLPLLVYLLWSVNGRHAMPFELWMTDDALRFWMVGIVAYLAAFLCGIRPARSYVSRWWPLVPALLVFLAQADFIGSFPIVCWCLILVGVGLLLPSVFFAAEDRDYA